jgi:peptidoglycan/LPS O-acetylase OafA/YrhL
MGFRWQSGVFLVYVGLIGLIVFFITDQQHIPLYAFFCGGILVTLGGVYLMYLGRGTPPPSQRFASWRKLSEKGEKKGSKDSEKDKIRSS